MPQATIATPSFLEELRGMYPSEAASKTQNPWYLITAVAFSASNRPEEVAALFKYLLTLPEFGEHEKRYRAAHRIRDGLFKSGFTAGYSRVINALIALHEVMPEELRDTKMLREIKPTQHYEQLGREFFKEIYGDTAEKTQKLLDDIYPDMGYLSNTFAYGFAYTTASQPQPPTLTAIETSYVLVATLISMDTARQVAWHLDGARRRGASVEEAEAVRAVVMKVCERCGVVWREGVPEVNRGDLK